MKRIRISIQFIILFLQHVEVIQLDLIAQSNNECKAIKHVDMIHMKISFDGKLLEHLEVE